MFKNDLIQQNNGSPFYSVLFDESLNSSLQQCQMDIHIRFWDEFKCEVTAQYFTSEFLQILTAKNLLEHLTEAVKPWKACSH